METFSKVNQLADNLYLPKKTTFLSSFFKNGIIKNFNRINNGYIILIEGEEKFSFGDPSDALQAKVTIISPEFYVLIGSGGVMGVAEAFMAGYWETNNLSHLLQIVLKNKSVLISLDSKIAKLLKPINKWIHYNKRNTISGSRKNIFAHYDLDNDFYKLWLDPTMTYSCAFFSNESVSLQEASLEKLDRICRKLNLTPKDTVLEIGTGWGSFAVYAVKKYGCKVITTTISKAQFDYAKKLIIDEGYESKITIMMKDYRALEGQFDKIVSIEMIEAVGHEFIPKFFSKVSSLLKPNGLMALQGITYNDQNFEIYKNSVDFIKKYIFPGSCLISISQIADVIKTNTDLAIVDMEDITLHYAETLSRWRTNFISALPEVKKLGFSEAFINMWDFYFSFCEAGFLERNIGDVQLVFAKSTARNIKISY